MYPRTSLRFAPRTLSAESPCCWSQRRSLRSHLRTELPGCDTGACPMELCQHVDHRPYPLPPGPWIMAQTWHNLLFAHWPVPLAALRPLVPAPLEIDTYDGQAWIGIIAFRLSRV